MKKILCLFTLVILLFTSCSSLQVNRCNPIYAMDTIIQVSFYNERDYQKHYDKIKEIYYLYNDISSNFDSDTLGSIYDLNIAREMTLSSELVELINYSIEMKEDTLGYFNPFLGKLNDLWKSYINNEITLPSSETINNLLLEANNTSVVIDGLTVKLIGTGNLDLGGIAKGYATLKVEEYLKENNVTGYLLNAGDSNISLGKKGDSDFTLAISKPYTDGYILTLNIRDSSIGTSSPKYQYKENEGIIYHHIINPFTGYSKDTYDSVTVFTSNACISDVYSTAIFSMELDEAISFINSKGIKAVLYKGDNILYQSDNL